MQGERCIPWRRKGTDEGRVDEMMTDRCDVLEKKHSSSSRETASLREQARYLLNCYSTNILLDEGQN